MVGVAKGRSGSGAERADRTDPGGDSREGATLLGLQMGAGRREALAVRVLGLTGNIACGKSSVAAALRQLGARTIDADTVVHGLYRRGTDTYRLVVERFGEAVAGEDGVRRAELAKRVFGDPAAMADLEALVHPAVIAEVRRLLDAPGQEPAAVIEAIKLVEGETAALVEALWIVTASRESQLRRIAASRAISEADALRRIRAQSSPHEKAKLFAEKRPGAPVVYIENDGPFQDTRRRVEEEWQMFLRGRA